MACNPKDIPLLLLRLSPIDRGTRVAQLVEHLTLAQVMISWDRAPLGGGEGPCSVGVCFSLCSSPYSCSLSLSQINEKILKKTLSLEIIFDSSPHLVLVLRSLWNLRSLATMVRKERRENHSGCLWDALFQVLCPASLNMGPSCNCWSMRWNEKSISEMTRG